MFLPTKVGTAELLRRYYAYGNQGWLELVNGRDRLCGNVPRNRIRISRTPERHSLLALRFNKAEQNVPATLMAIRLRIQGYWRAISVLLASSCQLVATRGKQDEARL
jgi:hypothetical protein